MPTARNHTAGAGRGKTYNRYQLRETYKQCQTRGKHATCNWQAKACWPNRYYFCCCCCWFKWGKKSLVCSKSVVDKLKHLVQNAFLRLFLECYSVSIRTFSFMNCAYTLYVYVYVYVESVSQQINFQGVTSKLFCLFIFFYSHCKFWNWLEAIQGNNNDPNIFYSISIQ